MAFLDVLLGDQPALEPHERYYQRLLADDPEEFAAATVRLLGDSRLRARLVEAAEALYFDRYDGRLANQGVRRLVEDVARASTRS